MPLLVHALEKLSDDSRHDCHGGSPAPFVLPEALSVGNLYGHWAGACSVECEVPALFSERDREPLRKREEGMNNPSPPYPRNPRQMRFPIAGDLRHTVERKNGPTSKNYAIVCPLHFQVTARY